jgi:hypothetical protein
MLPLDDDRWGQLTTFFEEPKHLPKVLRTWLESIGLNHEEGIYNRELFDLFLHQATITNAAFAVVPWLVQVCKEGRTNLRGQYLIDVALVEANRLEYGVCGNRRKTAPYPEWLMSDYHNAILDARKLVEEMIQVEQNDEIKFGLTALKPALYGNSGLAWSQWTGGSIGAA